MLADILAVAYTGSWSDFFNAEFTANFKIDFSHLPGHRFQTIDFVRNRDQVDMVRHEAISDEGDAVEDDVLAQQFEVDCSIGVASRTKRRPFPRCVTRCGTSTATTRVNRPMPGNDIRNDFGVPQVLQR